MLKEITEYDGIYLACGATDLRKSVEEELKELTPEERKSSVRNDPNRFLRLIGRGLKP